MRTTPYISGNEGGPNAARLHGLVVKYRDPLIRYFLRRGLSREASEDCVQDVFVRIARADQDTIDNAEAYLFSVASSVAIDHFRRRQTRQEDRHDLYEDQALAGAEYNPARLFEGRDALKRLEQILLELPARTREIFLLNRLDGFSYTQLAVRYRLNVKSIEKHMSKALAHLRQRFPIEERS